MLFIDTERLVRMTVGGNTKRPVQLHRASALCRSLPRFTSLAAIVGQASERNSSEAIADDPKDIDTTRGGGN
jgi:hypothetical protein